MAYQPFWLFNAKAILLEQLWYYLTHSWEDKEFHTFPNGICPKVNIIAWLEIELTYYDSAVHHFNHYTMRTPTSTIEKEAFSIVYMLQKFTIFTDNKLLLYILKFPIKNLKNPMVVS